MAYKRHNYRPLSAEERTEDRYPTYSFTVKDDKFAMDIAEQLFDTQVEDRTFTYQQFETKTGHLFKVKMHGEVTEDLKKILFKVGLKLQSGITTR